MHRNLKIAGLVVLFLILPLAVDVVLGVVLAYFHWYKPRYVTTKTQDENRAHKLSAPEPMHWDVYSLAYDVAEKEKRERPEYVLDEIGYFRNGNKRKDITIAELEEMIAKLRKRLDAKASGDDKGKTLKEKWTETEAAKLKEWEEDPF